jgi:hypothetical protein
LASRGFGTKSTFPFFFLTLHLDCVSGEWYLYIDPENLGSFQFDVRFDAPHASALGVEFVSPYVQTSPPDVSMLESGLLQDVGGASSVSPPPPGHVDIFRVHFEGLNASLRTEDVHFAAFASDNDFFVVFDTDTGTSTLYGPSDIEPVELSVRSGVRCPDSNSSLVNLAVLGGMALSARFMKRRVV